MVWLAEGRVVLTLGGPPAQQDSGSLWNRSIAGAAILKSSIAVPRGNFKTKPQKCIHTFFIFSG